MNGVWTRWVSIIATIRPRPAKRIQKSKAMNSSATLREKIGQMLLAGFRGCEIGGGEPIARDIAERNLGGVILFDKEMSDTSLRLRNIKSSDQVRALTDRKSVVAEER